MVIAVKGKSTNKPFTKEVVAWEKTISKSQEWKLEYIEE